MCIITHWWYRQTQFLQYTIMCMLPFLCNYVLFLGSASLLHALWLVVAITACD